MHLLCEVGEVLVVVDVHCSGKIGCQGCRCWPASLCSSAAPVFSGIGQLHSGYAEASPQCPGAGNGQSERVWLASSGCDDVCTVGIEVHNFTQKRLDNASDGSGLSVSAASEVLDLSFGSVQG